MRVTVRVYGHLEAALGSRELYVELPEGSTLGVVLDQIAGNMGPPNSGFGFQEDGLHVLVNGQDSRLLRGRETLLPDNCVVDLIPPFEGG